MSPTSEHEDHQSQIDPATSGGTVEAPTSFFGIVGRLGPGLIVAGSIVGSGELILTTKTGAQGGIALLWLILVGCVIKVFVQVELGRYAICRGETTLSALNRVPGPRLRVNWILWFWVITMVCTTGQQGGIVGGVGQAMALTWPVTGDYVDAIRTPSESEFRRFIKWEDDINGGESELSRLSPQTRVRVLRGQEALRERIERLGERGERILRELRDPAGELIDPWTVDDKVWATVVALLTAGVLYRGRYRFIQTFSTFLVVSFTIITIGNVIALQATEQWSISLSEYLRGLSFGAPEVLDGKNPWLTALATFGIIGVGAMELIVYPYWCLEKGYGKFTGKRSDDDTWAKRARGWMRVMHYDAFASMVVYTVATIAFFLMGVAVLYREGLDPDGMRMVSTLAEAYVPVFGSFAKWLFLVGAVAVLYSTFLVANAGHARMITDAIGVFGYMDRDNDRSRDRCVANLSFLLPLCALSVYLMGANPVELVLLSGTMQATLLPILGFSAIYFRYKWTDPRLRPGRFWDILLIVSCIGLLIAGVWGVYHRLMSIAG